MKIQLDKERPLRFDFNALAEFEEMTGKNALDIDSYISSARCLRALCFVGIKHGDFSTKMSLEDVGRYLKASQLEDIARAVSDDLGSDMGKETENPSE